MKSSRFGPSPAIRRVLAALTLATAAASTALSASAAIVVGVFDPAFGPSIDNLGFRGTMTVQVPDACFLQTPGFIANGDSCSGNGMSVLSATVDFYNLATPSLTFASIVITTPGSVAGIVTGAGSPQNELLGVDAAFSLPDPVSLIDVGLDGQAGGGDDVAFFGDMRLRFYALVPGNLPPPGVPAYAAVLEACPVEDVGEGLSCNESNPAATVFASRNAVPEPGSAALLAAALGAALWAGRRRPGPPEVTSAG